ncbi:type II secretion system protein J [Fredinandcohnia sp. 179-A 10B2 NHS]|uniref:PulJ/GspJ family protein n=1 Tax=Fredinandcohnia sp. 179-A 10B2 NHS TaxID=3235176 RepID=UPI0039A39A35
MKSIDNQKGFTLIELLASLAIFAIIAGLGTGILLNSMNYYEKSKNKLSLGQEANILLSQITNLHQTSDEYVLSFNSTTGEVKLNSEKVGKPNLSYEILAGAKDYSSFSGDLLVKTDRPLYIKLNVEDTENSLSYSVKTVINRKQ